MTSQVSVVSDQLDGRALWCELWMDSNGDISLTRGQGCTPADAMDLCRDGPAALIHRWESVYRRYADLAQVIGRSPNVRPGEARAMASASWDVATAWRDMATAAVLPWWTLAALRAAADAFEQQSYTWHDRSIHDDSHPTGTRPPR